MDKELKQKWIDALRSGRYSQTKECLNDGTGFCCLGVLADIMGVEWKKEIGNETDVFTYVFYFDDEQQDVTLPTSFSGLEYSVQEKLMQMNDGQAAGLRIPQANFMDIADWIEKNEEI